MRDPRVSVVLTSYNYAEFLPAALDSVLAQSYPAAEVIVVDDGSTDGSREILERYPVHVIHQANAGQAAALDAGVAAATGDFVCLLDADDTWYPHKVARVVEALEGAPGAMWLRHRLAVTDASLTPTGAATPHIRTSGPMPADAILVSERLRTASTSSLALRRTMRDEVFPLASSGRLRYDADALLVARLGSRHTGWQLRDVLGSYRMHERQQYAGERALGRLLERQVEVGMMVSGALGRPEPVSNYKHRAILAHLQGRRRAPEVARGLGACGHLATHPAVLLRQAAGLLQAGLAPRWWIRRFKRGQGSSS